MGIRQTVAPTQEPVSMSEAKAHLRIIGNDDDAAVASYLLAARQTVENDLQRQLVTATWELTLDNWGNDCKGIELPRPPLASISTVKYRDANGVLQTVASTVYEAVINREPGILRLAWNQVWPDHRSQRDAITITYVAGYGAPSAVPGGIKAMVLILLADMYENRELLNIGNVVNDLPTYGRLQEYYRVRTLP